MTKMGMIKVAEDWEHPALWYKVVDELGNNRLFSFIYSGYIKTLRIRGSEDILDFGSGSGAGSRHLAKLIQNRGGSLTCLDTSVYWTKKAEKRMRKYQNIHFVNRSLTEANFDDHSFDLIYVFFALHDVAVELRPGIVAQMHRLLRPDGRLCIKEPQREEDGMSVAEIRELMLGSGFYEASCRVVEKNVFSGEYKKKK